MQAGFFVTVFYNRDVELSKSVILPLSIFFKTCCLGTCTDISFANFTPIYVFKNKQIKVNKVFKGTDNLGWFYDFILILKNPNE